MNRMNELESRKRGEATIEKDPRDGRMTHMGHLKTEEDQLFDPPTNSFIEAKSALLSSRRKKTSWEYVNSGGITMQLSGKIEHRNAQGGKKQTD